MLTCLCVHVYYACVEACVCCDISLRSGVLILSSATCPVAGPQWTGQGIESIMSHFIRWKATSTCSPKSVLQSLLPMLIPFPISLTPDASPPEHTRRHTSTHVHTHTDTHTPHIDRHMPQKSTPQERLVPAYSRQRGRVVH